MAKKSVVTQTHPATSPSPSGLLQPALSETLAAPVVARGRCTQCGKTLRHLPLFLGNITCRECYGAERYQRGPGVPIGGSSLSAPQRDNSYRA